MNRQNATQREPRLFHLIRQVDGSGADGTGPVAEGVEWSDGTVALRWRGRWPATSAWEGGLDAVLAVHGSTVVRWLAVPLLRRKPETAAGDEVLAPPTIGARVPTASADGRCSRCGRPWPCLRCGP